MAVPSPHLDRKLKESLGNEAGEELAAVMDRIDPMRGDIAELRHAMEKGFVELRHAIEKGSADQHAQLERAVLFQTRWRLGSR